MVTRGDGKRLLKAHQQLQTHGLCTGCKPRMGMSIFGTVWMIFTGWAASGKLTISSRRRGTCTFFARGGSTILPEDIMGRRAFIAAISEALFTRLWV